MTRADIHPVKTPLFRDCLIALFEREYFDHNGKPLDIHRYTKKILCVYVFLFC